MSTQLSGTIEAVHASPLHDLRKQPQPRIRLLTGLGIEGDAHIGATVQHVSRARKQPEQPNLRQVHLIHAELHEQLRAAGFEIAAGAMGENVTTRGVDLLGLSEGTLLHLGAEAVVRVTGLRDPCAQLERLQPGLMAATLGRDAHGALVRKAGIMAVVVRGGDVQPGDTLRVEAPAGPHRPLQVV